MAGDALALSYRPFLLGGYRLPLGILVGDLALDALILGDVALLLRGHRLHLGPGIRHLAGDALILGDGALLLGGLGLQLGPLVRDLAFDTLILSNVALLLSGHRDEFRVLELLLHFAGDEAVDRYFDFTFTLDRSISDDFLRDIRWPGGGNRCARGLVRRRAANGCAAALAPVRLNR